MRRHRSLKQVYYISFSGMVLIPILLVFLISLSVIHRMMLNSAAAAIRSSQEAVADSLDNSVRDASLQLSHFVYVNNNEVLDTAAMTDTDDARQRYEYSTRLDQLFQVAMAPKQQVISGMFYMKDGRYTYVKQELAIPMEEVKESDWYREACRTPNQVFVGTYDSSETKVVMSTDQRGELAVAVGISPGVGVDRSGKIELVMLLFRTQAGDYLRNKKNGLSGSVILDKEGRIIFRAGDSRAAEGFLSGRKISSSSGEISSSGQEITFSGQEFSISGQQTELPAVSRAFIQEPDSRSTVNYTCMTTPVQETGWTIITCVKTSSLTADFNRVARWMLLVIGTLFLLYLAFSRFFLQNIIRPVHTMVEGLKQVEEGNLEMHIEPVGQYEIRSMIHSFNRMVRQLNVSIQERQAAQEKKMKAELRALQSQINPHFLVNTLSSIRFMAQVSKFEGIRRMAEALIRILTCSFRSNESLYTVREELEVLESYLYLMKIRYSDGFEVVWEIQEECKDVQIPRLVLQPVVENAIVHGFSQLEEEIGCLTICCFLEGETLCMEVRDNGRGMTREEISRVMENRERRPDDNYSIGLENVSSRLKLHFKEGFRMEIESQPGLGTTVRIRIPAEHKEKNHESGGNRR